MSTRHTSISCEGGQRAAVSRATRHAWPWCVGRARRACTWCVYVGRVRGVCTWGVCVGHEEAAHEHCLQGALSESRGAGEIARRLHASKIAHKLAGIGLKLR